MMFNRRMILTKDKQGKIVIFSQNLTQPTVVGQKVLTITPLWKRVGNGQYFDLILYHGTDFLSATLIVDTQCFKSSSQGNLGPGIYFTDDKNKASTIAKHRTKNRGCKYNPSVLLVCRVKVYEKYCRKGYHGKWEGVCQGFNEYCLQKEQGYLAIVQAQLLKAEDTFWDSPEEGFFYSAWNLRDDNDQELKLELKLETK